MLNHPQKFIKRSSNKKKKENYDYNDALYGIFCWFKSDAEYDSEMLPGRQAFLNYQFEALNHQRDVINILDTFYSVKDQVTVIERKIEKEF